MACNSQAGDEAIQASVDQMQKVIELGRVIRDRKSKPLKQPLRQLTIVHHDEAVLSSLQGELSEYVYQETNVKELAVCSDPQKFGTLRAEPVFSVQPWLPAIYRLPASAHLSSSNITKMSQ